jgi:hypothetical protein
MLKIRVASMLRAMKREALLFFLLSKSNQSTAAPAFLPGMTPRNGTALATELAAIIAVVVLPEGDEILSMVDMLGGVCQLIRV